MEKMREPLNVDVANDDRLLLQVMRTYHRKLELVNDLFNKMMKGEIKQLTESQRTALNKLYANSWYKKQMNRDINLLREQQEVKDLSRAMNQKFREQYPEPNTTIGFRNPSPVSKQDNDVYSNRYTITNAKKAPTNAERFDDVFGDF